MIIFIYGEDTFRAKEKVVEIKARFTEKFDPTGLNFLEFKTRPEIGEAMNAITASPFMGERRMVIFRELLSGLKKVELENWIAVLQKTPESTIVICLESAKPPKIVGAEVHEYPMPTLTDAELPRWIRERVVSLGMTIEPVAVEELVIRVGSDLWRMQNELEKLRSLSQPLTLSTIRSLVSTSFNNELFDLIDALSRRDKISGMRLLEEQRQSGMTDARLLNMLIRQVRILLGARALLDENARADKQELATLLELHPFVAQKTMQQARSFNIETLKRMHAMLFTFEQKLKTGKMDLNLAVDLTVAAFVDK
ncbi:MAG: DNA polymerase III subunit delta [Patescibacteria group bacterium]